MNVFTQIRFGAIYRIIKQNSSGIIARQSNSVSKKLATEATIAAIRNRTERDHMPVRWFSCGGALRSALAVPRLTNQHDPASHT